MAYTLTNKDESAVSSWAQRSGYGLSKRRLKTFVKQHQNGNDRQRAMIEAKLDYINFHNEAESLRSGNYAKAEFLAGKGWDAGSREAADRMWEREQGRQTTQQAHTSLFKSTSGRLRAALERQANAAGGGATAAKAAGGQG